MPAGDHCPSYSWPKRLQISVLSDCERGKLSLQGSHLVLHNYQKLKFSDLIKEFQP
jgi:hypothetical protein